MNQQQIECFLAAAENKSFTKAGKLLFMSQPAVSKLISSLEKEMGTALFFRVRHRNIELTQIGKLYYDFFSKCRDEFNQIQKYAMELDERIKGKLKIGVLTGWNVNSFMESVIARFQTRYPNMEVQLFFMDLEPLRKAVCEGILDVIVTIEDSLYDKKTLQSFLLEKVPRVLFYSKKHMAGSNKEYPEVKDFCDSEFEIVSDRDFDTEKLVYEYLTPYQIKPKIRLVPSIEAAIARTYSGMGVAVIDAWSREMDNASLGHIILESYNQAVLAWSMDNKNPSVSYLVNEFSNYEEEKRKISIYS